MAQEEKELLLKDLCARLPYGVMVQDELGRINKLVIGNADLVRLYYNDFSIYGENALSLPFLRQLSSMTNEEKEEYINIKQGECNGCVLTGKGDSNTEFLLVDFFNAHHFDYHELIPKGLAIEAPEGMYKTK